jgi:hypothetical protein
MSSSDPRLNNSKLFFDKFVVYSRFQHSTTLDEIKDFIAKHPIYWDAMLYHKTVVTYNDDYDVRRLLENSKYVRETILFKVVDAFSKNDEEFPELLVYLMTQENVNLYYTYIFLSIFNTLSLTSPITKRLFAEHNMATIENFTTLLTPAISPFLGKVGYDMNILDWKRRVGLIPLFFRYGNRNQFLNLKYKSFSFLYAFVYYNYIASDKPPKTKSDLLFTASSQESRVHPNILRKLISMGMKFQDGEIDKLVAVLETLPSIADDPYWKSVHLGYLEHNLRILKSVQSSYHLNEAKTVFQILDSKLHLDDGSPMEIPRDIAASVAEKTRKLSPHSTRVFQQFTKEENIRKRIQRQNKNT